MENGGLAKSLGKGCLGCFQIIIPEIGIFSSGNQVSEFLLPFNHLYQACSGPGLCQVPVDTFQLSGSRKICISFGNHEDENGKTESWRNTYCGVDLKKMRFVLGGFSCSNSPTSCTCRQVVDGYNRNILSLPKHHIRISRVFAPWCDPLFETQGATHWVLQPLVWPIVFYNTSNSLKTRLIKWKQRPGIRSWISKLCFLISRNYLMEAVLAFWIR